MDSSHYDSECFVCFHPLTPPIFHLKCCNHFIHTNCLIHWSKYNHLTCLICNQPYQYTTPWNITTNNTHTPFYYANDISNISSTHTINDIENQINNNSNNDIQFSDIIIQNNSNNYNQNKKLCILLVNIFLLLIITFGTITLIIFY